MLTSNTKFSSCNLLLLFSLLMKRLGDNDLGLAVIERWTHYFIQNYQKHTNPWTTLYQTMVSPFDKKNILLARVGTKDDTSRSKFKDTKLSDFFGPKGGKTSSGKHPKDRIVDKVSTENLLKLPRDSVSRNKSKSQHAIQQSKAETCSTKGNGAVNLLDNGVFIIAAIVFATLMLSKKLEKLYLKT